VAALVLSPVVAGAAPLTADQIYEPVGSYRFCAEAQLDVANIDEQLMNERGISITTVIWGAYNDLLFSKSGVDVDEKKIITGEGIEWLDAESTDPGLLRCKMRTGESLDEGAWPEGSANNAPRFQLDPYYGFGDLADGVSTSDVDQPCAVVNQRTIDNVWANLSPAERAASDYSPEGDTPTLVTTPDSPSESGPEWLGPYPVLNVAGDVLQVRSKTLFTPTGFSTPRFDGARYCTFVAPQYLRDVLLGTQAVVA